MKKWLLLTIVLALVAMSAVPAMAKGRVANQPVRVDAVTGSNLYAFSGRITAIDSENLTLTVWVKTGNVLAKPYEGMEIVLHTTADTVFEVSHSPATITFDDLFVGCEISSIGTLIDGIWTADRVTAT